MTTKKKTKANAINLTHRRALRSLSAHELTRATGGYEVFEDGGGAAYGASFMTSTGDYYVYYDGLDGPGFYNMIP